jgi:hypothetical protein
MTTDVSHLLIEALDKGEGQAIYPRDMTHPSGEQHKEWRDYMRRFVLEAHKFDISGARHTFSSELVETAYAQNAHRELHTPFQVCLFDLGDDVDGDRLLVLTIETDNRIDAIPFTREGSTWLSYAMRIQINKGQLEQPQAVQFISAYHEVGVSLPATFDPDSITSADVTKRVFAVMCALAMMGSESVKLEAVKASKFINSKRVAKGKIPLNDYTLVTIDVDRVRRDTERLGGSHASPRLHWRRGHKRHLPDGKTTWVRPCLVGDPFAGTVSHDYALTGKAA